MPAPRWKNINVFPWRQESGKEGQLCTVRFSLSSLSTLPRPRKISRSSLSYSPPEVECKAIRPAYWTLARVREIRFSRIFVSDKTMAAIDSVEKRSGVFKPLENWRGNGRENACVCTTSLLTFERKGKNERGWGGMSACSNPLAEDSPQTRLRSCFPPFFSKLCWICPTD